MEELAITTTETKVEKLPPLKIMIGISILSYSHDFVQSFLNFWTQLVLLKSPHRDIQVAYNFKYRRPVHMAQEELAVAAMDAGCTHLLLMDDDIYDVTAVDLLRLVEADKDVIGGVMFTSRFPYALCAFRRYNLKTRVAEQPILDGSARLYEIPVEQQKGIVACDLIPFGFTLIKTSVFEKLEKPYFTCNVQAPTDSWFMDSIMDVGIQPYVHFDVWLNHNQVTRNTRPYLSEMEMKKIQANGTKVINLTAEEMTRHMLAMDLKMKDAEEERRVKEAGEYKFVTL